MNSSLPRYLDAMLLAWHRGHTSRAVHLGLWDETLPGILSKGSAEAFTAAQARLDGAVLNAAAVAPGMRVLDVGCGLGGTLATLNAQLAPLQMTGLNIDVRQLAVCAQLQPRATSGLHWVQGDACALPFAAATFDRVLCVEAMFHFSSRRAFLREAARVLLPGGVLVLTDIRGERGTGASPMQGEQEDALVTALVQGFGPWPTFWQASDAVHQAAEEVGLVLSHCQDWTAHTLHSHRYTAPASAALSAEPVARACAALAALHRGGKASVRLECYRRV